MLQGVDLSAGFPTLGEAAAVGSQKRQAARSFGLQADSAIGWMNASNAPSGVVPLIQVRATLFLLGSPRFAAKPLGCFGKADMSHPDQS